MPDVDDELVELAHDFAEREMRPHAARYDESGEFPWDGRPQGGRGSG